MLLDTKWIDGLNTDPGAFQTWSWSRRTRGTSVVSGTEMYVTLSVNTTLTHPRLPTLPQLPRLMLLDTEWIGGLYSDPGAFQK